MRFQEPRRFSQMWLNFTGSEHKPHAVLSRKYRFFQGENAPEQVIYATGRISLEISPLKVLI
jgi:hypothetical protein